MKKAIPPDRILLYLLDKRTLPFEKGLVVYQKDLTLAVCSIKYEDNITGAMEKLMDILVYTTIFPSESYTPSEKDIKKLRKTIL